MFWKKKKDKEKGAHHLFKEPSSPRNSFRVTPHQDRPVILTFKDKSLTALNISSGGISFYNLDFKLNEVYEAYLVLPDVELGLPAKVKVLIIDKENICHCDFENMEPEYEDLIHYYVLLRQKEELAEQKPHPL